MKFPLNGEELKSTFGNNREPNKWHSPSGATSELYGALLEDLGPASAPSSWVDPLDSFSFTMLCQDGRSKRGVAPGDAPCAARSEGKRCVRAVTFPPVPRALVSSPPFRPTRFGLVHHPPQNWRVAGGLTTRAHRDYALS